jgi:hypothetical protein
MLLSIIGAIASGLASGIASIIGKYWFSTVNTSWYPLSSWYSDAGKATQATALPNGSTDVIILSGGLIPYVNLDNLGWVQPLSIDASGIGITFYSNLSASVTCTLSGSPITFTGNSQFGA